MGDSSTQQHRRTANRARFVGAFSWTLALLVGSAMAASAPADAAPPVDPAPLAVRGDGIRVSRNGVLFGSCRRTKSPAEVDLKKAWQATPEARKIDAEGIRRGSAEYGILRNKGIKRIRGVIQSVAVDQNHDCVIKKGALTSNPSGLTITDITDDVVSALEQLDIDDLGQ